MIDDVRWRLCAVSRCVGRLRMEKSYSVRVLFLIAIHSVLLVYSCASYAKPAEKLYQTNDLVAVTSDSPVSPDKPDSLQLYLVGVFHSSVDINSVAYITTNGKDQQTYRVSDQIIGNLYIESINRDHVTVYDGSNINIILLKGLQAFDNITGDYKTTDVNDSSVDVVNNEKYKHSEIVIKHPDRDTDFIQLRDDNIYNVNRDYLTKMLDSGRLLEHASFEAVDGEGVNVNKILAGSFFQRAGLVKNDTINEINGVKVDSYEKLYALAEEYGDTDFIELMVSRNNKVEYLYYFMGNEY